MAVVPHRSPDDPAFAPFDRTLFRVDHGLFFLRPGPLRARVAAILESRRGWDLKAAGLLAEDARLRGALEWLDTLADDGDDVAPPRLEHEPAIDLVAAGLIGDGEYTRVACPACDDLFPPDRIRLEPWDATEDGTTVRGRRAVCPAGHILHAAADLVDVPDLETAD